MASSKFGRKLNPYWCLRELLGVKCVRQSVVITNNPSTIDQNQQLLVRFPNLGAYDVIVPGTACLAFRITLDSEDANRTVVQNLGRAIVKKTVIKISGNEVISSTVTAISGRRPRRGKMSSTRAATPLVIEIHYTIIRIDAGNKDETVAADIQRFCLIS